MPSTRTFARSVVIPRGARGSHPQGLAADKNGDLWFTDDQFIDDGRGAIGMYDHTSRTITVPVDGPEPGQHPKVHHVGHERQHLVHRRQHDRPGDLDDRPDAACAHAFTPHYMAMGSEPWAIENDRQHNVLWLTDRKTPAIWRFRPE